MLLAGPFTAFWVGAAWILCTLTAMAQPRATIRVVDVLRVQADAPASAAVLTLTPPKHPHEISCDILVAGASTGGVAAALAAASQGHSVCVTEETHWVGGQMTSQGVSALDENRFITPAGAPASYLSMRQKIRAYYKTHFTLSPQSAAEARFNPGNCWVSRLCFEPPVALQVLNSMLAPYQKQGLVRVFLRTKIVRARRSGDRITSMLAYNFHTHDWTRFRARYYLDATDLGELLPLTGAAYVTGAEARKTTGEPNAPDMANPGDDQSLTYTFVLKKGHRQTQAIAMPPNYQQNLAGQPYTLKVNYGHGRFLVYGMFVKRPGTPGSFWNYRSIIAPENFSPSSALPALSMVNWTANDTCASGVLSNDALQQAKGLQKAKQVALGFAYWLQHEAPHDDGAGHGYPELQLVKNQMGSDDGLSQFPYIRESRRILAIQTVKEEQIAVPFQKNARAERFSNSVGIGYYSIDIHGCSKEDFASKTKPFQLPLGVLIPQRITNLLAASKDIGTTHITNGAYREHPEEWTTGTAAGMLAAFAIDHRLTPREIEANPALVLKLQLQLVHNGDPIFWFDDLSASDPSFPAVQILAAHGVFGANSQNLHFYPHQPVTRAEAVAALSCAIGGPGRACGEKQASEIQAQSLAARGYLPKALVSPSSLDRPIRWDDLALAEAKTGVKFPPTVHPTDTPTRTQFAEWLEPVYLHGK